MLMSEMYGDDVKMYTSVDNAHGVSSLQDTLNTFVECDSGLDLELSVNKCALLNVDNNRPTQVCVIGSKTLTAKTVMKNLGVVKTK